MFDPLIIKATTINDAWHQLVFQVEEKGRKYKITQGSFVGQYRYEFEFVLIVIERPWEDTIPIFPPGITLPPPTTLENNEQYFANYIFNPDLAEDEQYTYGFRIVGELVDDPNQGPVNQVGEIIKKYKNGGFGNNQCTIEIGMPGDILLSDPPCLRVIDTRIQDGVLHFFVYFRSWDLWGGFPVNLGGIEILKQFLAKEIGVANGKIIAASKGLHIYDHHLKYVRIRRGEAE